MTSEEIKKYLIYLACAVVLVAGGYWIYLSFISGNGTRDADIRAKFATLEANQLNLTTQLNGLTKDLAASQQRVVRIESRIDNASAGIGHVASNITDSQESLTESAGLIDENQRIISAIQQRAKSQN